MVPALQRAELARSPEATMLLPATHFRNALVSPIARAPRSQTGAQRRLAVGRARAFPAPARSARHRALTSRGACPGSPRAQARVGARSSPRRRRRVPERGAESGRRALVPSLPGAGPCWRVRATLLSLLRPVSGSLSRSWYLETLAPADTCLVRHGAQVLGIQTYFRRTNKLFSALYFDGGGEGKHLY